MVEIRQSSRVVKGASLKLMCACLASSNLAFVIRECGETKSGSALKKLFARLAQSGRARDF